MIEYNLSEFISFSHSTGSEIIRKNKAGNSISFFFPCPTTPNQCGPITVYLQKGKYLLEAWGAKGGENGFGSMGGNGGYSKGLFIAAQETTLFIYIGGQGQSNATLNAKGGYNGGGDGSSTQYKLKHGAGGGSTDFRLTHSLTSRFIVAGGGGGAGNRKGEQNDGGEGGGLYGENGKTPNYGWNGNGGTSTNGGIGACYTPEVCSQNGTFLNGSQGMMGSSSSGGGGGGGFYGGSGGHCSGGGGGSGYISSFITGNTITGNQLIDNPLGGKERGHNGDGAAKITIISCKPNRYLCTPMKKRQTTFSSLLHAFVLIIPNPS